MSPAPKAAGHRSRTPRSNRQRPLRVFAGGIGTETNVWSPLITGYDCFDIAAGDAAQEERERLTFGSTFGRYAEKATSRRNVLVLGTYAFAHPGGLTTSDAWERLRDRLLREIAAARPLDAVVLTLHGAMAAYEEPDCEVDLVRRLRELVGREVVVGVLLDLHCKLSCKLVELSDVIVTFKEYPHVDVNARADELYDLVVATAERIIAPACSMFDCRMVGQYPTNVEPMRSFVDRLHQAEREQGVLSVSLSHGFPSGDGETVTARVLVVTDAEPVRGTELARALGAEFFALRHRIGMKVVDLAAILDDLPTASGAPLVIADVADNPGSGAPGDSTFILRELLERGVTNAALALLWDPQAVDDVWEAEIGDRLNISLGGKASASSGGPVDVDAVVLGKRAELLQYWPQADGTAAPVSCGRAVWLQAHGIDVVANSHRTQVFGTEVFGAFEPSLLDRRVLIVKSKQHFVAAFSAITDRIAYVDTPGPVKLDVTAIPYERFTRRAFPWLENPWKDVLDPRVKGIAR